ncbi:MAG TPA: hypothetical protein VE090_01615 [Methylomirabilota bacterium]|nr:hypothetical protein [Methylomirabilota bacterium]
MTSFVVISKEQKKRTERIRLLCEERKINSFDQTIIALETTVKQNTQSIGIEDIKQMQKKVFLKPIKSQTKAIIVEDAQLLTIEAQNALLKILEEPPEHTIIILSTASKEALLPTILSRCFIIELEETAFQLSEKEKTEYEIFINNLSEWGIGEQLKKAELLAKEKEKALLWLTKLIIFLREKMLAQPEEKAYFLLINTFLKLYQLLKTTNTNTRFALEETFLAISF